MQQTQSPRHTLKIGLNQNQSHYTENRLAGRYPTFCTVELDSGTGFTRNLSTLGVCFTTDSEIKPNSMLRCFILMQKKGKNMARMRCEGRVVRANKSADGWEVAIHFTTLEW
jgi:hypothetical protein